VKREEVEKLEEIYLRWIFELNSKIPGYIKGRKLKGISYEKEQEKKHGALKKD